jgi:iron complex outermembrane receptor protein
VLSAAKYTRDVRQVAGSVTIVTAEDIRRFGYRTLTDVLQSMAGVYVSSQRSMESFGVRAFGRPTDCNNRILLLIKHLESRIEQNGRTFVVRLTSRF